MATARLYYGGARSGREHIIDGHVADRWNEALLVVPTRAEANDRAARIIQSSNLAGAWGERVVSFEDFALLLVRDTGIYPHVLDESDRRVLLERAIDPLRASTLLNPLHEAADTPGFVAHMQRIITKLKQAAVEPAAFREAIARRSRPSWLDPIVAAIYEAYQSALAETQSYDHVGLYWQAAIALNPNRPKLFDRVRLLAFDGFDDFTPSEFRVIRNTAPHVDTLLFGIACSLDVPSQRDLFAIPIRTAEQLIAAFDGMQTIPCQSDPPTLRHAFAAQELFWRSMPAAPGTLVENLTLHACHDGIHECEFICREVKKLIIENAAAPESIAVVFRKLDDASVQLRLSLREFGVPANFGVARTLADSSLAAFVLGLLDVAETWERDSVLDLLTSHWFGLTPNESGALDVMARRAGIIEGEHEWLRLTERLIAWLIDGAGESRDGLLSRMPGALDTAKLLNEAAKRLVSYTSRLPRNGLFSAYVYATRTILDDLAVSRRVELLQDDDLRALERDSLTAIHAVLNRLLAWDARMPLDKKIDLAAFRAALDRAFAETALPLGPPLRGVHVIDVETARHKRFEHVFLGGLNEGEFPSPPSADAVYTDEDREDLERAGVPIEKRSKHLEREMLLLHHVLEGASKSATITWKTVSHDGRPLAPSPFVDDLKELAPQGESVYPTTASYLPVSTDVCSLRDVWNVSAFANENELPPSFNDSLAPIVAGAAIENERGSAAPFGQYDGVLVDREGLASLQESYGPAHAFSAAQLETYAKCPFQFYLERVLRVAEVEEAVAEFDRRTSGSILHETLHRFHETFVNIPTPQIPEEDANEVMTRLFEEIFERHARREISAPSGIIAVERARLHATLLRYVAIERNTTDEWKPSHFEVAFGQAHGTSANPLNRVEPFSLETSAGPILISGRIDRIDRLDDVSRIIDYKSKVSVTGKDILAGVALQLPLYALALEGHLLPNVRCEAAQFIQPGAVKPTEIMKRDKDEWHERESAVRDGVARCVNGLRGGHFPPAPYDSQCYICAASRACRFEQWRVELKNGSTNESDS